MRRLAAGMTALWVALTLLRRMWRGEVVVLSQHGAPVVRLLAIALVFLASCVEKVRAVAQPQPQAQQPGEQPAAPEPVVAVEQGFPVNLDDATLQRVYNWIAPRELHLHLRCEALAEGGPSDPLPPLGRADEAMHRRAAELQRAIEDHRRPGVTAVELLALLDAAEAVGVYDEWLAGHLWRHARTLRPAPILLLARIERHLRIVHALVLAQASVGPLEFSAWRSKAGPPPGWTGLTVPAGLVAAAREAFAGGADAGTWASEATLELTVVSGDVTLIQRASETWILVGGALRLRRLDVVRASTATVLRHPALGELRLPAGVELTAWNVAQFLGAEGRAWVQARVRAALDGESRAVTELEAVLPAAHEAIRATLAAEGRDLGERGAPLRMVLQAYDE
ncbi:MAG: hypothetical protein EKK62_16225 [Acidimicrobiia bacterium]|nr:MAG: hypothetical protein EKK62_16225 [Acidimicrobiia bacterium]